MTLYFFLSRSPLALEVFDEALAASIYEVAGNYTDHNGKKNNDPKLFVRTHAASWLSRSLKTTPLAEKSATMRSV
ncbi:hypothetical protein D3C80_2040490 [compost metagenome]